MTAAEQPAVRQLWPLLLVKDLEQSLAFWQDKLGFTLAGQAATDQGKIFWCRLERGGASVMLQQADAEDGSFDRPGHRISFYFICDDADAIYAEFTARGLKLQPPTVAHYRMKQVFIPDPDGYSICFESEVFQENSRADVHTVHHVSHAIAFCRKDPDMAMFKRDDPETPKNLRSMFGPNQADHQVRQAIQICWMMLPEDAKTVDELEKQFRRLVDRAIADLREDADAFGLEK